MARTAKTNIQIKNAGVLLGSFDTFDLISNITASDAGNGVVDLSASGSSGPTSWTTPVETPNGTVTVFTVGSSAPTDVVADGILMYNGAGYSYASNQITFKDPPSQYVRYR